MSHRPIPVSVVVAGQAWDERTTRERGRAFRGTWGSWVRRVRPRGYERLILPTPRRHGCSKQHSAHLTNPERSSMCMAGIHVSCSDRSRGERKFSQRRRPWHASPCARERLVRRPGRDGEFSNLSAEKARANSRGRLSQLDHDRASLRAAYTLGLSSVQASPRRASKPTLWRRRGFSAVIHRRRGQAPSRFDRRCVARTGGTGAQHSLDSSWMLQRQLCRSFAAHSENGWP
jgi:hypothetical protein